MGTGFRVRQPCYAVDCSKMAGLKGNQD